MKKTHKQIPIFEQTGDGMKFNPDGYCLFLKKEGLNFEERVDELAKVLALLRPGIRERIRREEAEYDSNPDIGKEYRDDYSIQDFTPIVGRIIHNKRNQKKKERSFVFYDRANSEPLPKIVSKLYSVYEFAAISATALGALYLLGLYHPP